MIRLRDSWLFFNRRENSWNNCCALFLRFVLFRFDGVIIVGRIGKFLFFSVDEVARCRTLILVLGLLHDVSSLSNFCYRHRGRLVRQS